MRSVTAEPYAEETGLSGGDGISSSAPRAYGDGIGPDVVLVELRKCFGVVEGEYDLVGLPKFDLEVLRETIRRGCGWQTANSACGRGGVTPGLLGV